jgi:hypothetical protein
MDERTIARLYILPLGLRAQPRQDVLAVGRSRAQVFDAGVALLAVADEIAMAAGAAGSTAARPSVAVGRCGVALEKQASRALRELVHSMAAPVHLHTRSVADAREWRVGGEARSTSVEAVRVSPPYQAVVLPLRRLDAAGLVARAPHARGAGGTVRAGQADLAGAAVAGGEDGAGLVVLVVS